MAELRSPKMRNKLKRESGNAAVGTAIIVIVMVIVFGATFVWMYSMDLLFLPDFIENIFSIDDNKDELSFASGELSELVREGKNERGETVTFDDTYENLRAALLSEPEPDGIYICADISHYKNGEPSVRRVRYYRDGQRFRAEIYAPGDEDTPELLKIGDSEHITVTDRTTGESRTSAMSAESFENEAMIPSVSVLLDAIEAFPGTAPVTSADIEISPDSTGEENGAEVSDCEIKLVDTETGKLYFVSFTYNDLNIREEYFISLDYRIIVSGITYYGGNPIYSYDTVRISSEKAVYGEDELYSFSSETA